MSTATAPRHYRLTRPGGLGFFRRRSAAQFCLVSLGILCGLLAAVLDGAGVPGRAALATIGAMAVVAGAMRLPGGEDLLALVGPAARFGVRRVSGRTRWAAPIADSGIALAPLCAGMSLVNLDARATRRAGIVLDRADGSLSAVLRVHGAGFLLAETSEQDERCAALADVLAGIARSGSPVTRVTCSHARSSAPLAAHLAYLTTTRRSDLDADIASAYTDLLGTAAREAVATEVLLTVTVSLGRVRVARGTDRLATGIERLLEETDLVTAALARAGLVAAGPLPASALATALRVRLDPGAARRFATAALARTETGDALSGALPLAIEEHRASIVCDGRHHRVLRVATWPRTPVRADWLAGFLAEAEVAEVLTVQLAPVPPGAARREALAAATRVGAAIAEREEHGRRVGAEEERARLAADALDTELAAGAALEVVAALCDVSAESRDALERATERLTERAAGAGIELRVLGLRQAEALAAALPLGRAIAGRPR